MKDLSKYKMTNTYYDYIFRNYIEFHETGNNEIVDWEPGGRNDIIIYYADGRKVFYDDISGCPHNTFKRLDGEEFVDDETFAKRFAWKLNAALNRSGISREEIFQRTGISKAALSNYFTGRKLPGASNLRKLAKVLRCSVQELVDVDEWNA